jgi:hypothetical protein
MVLCAVNDGTSRVARSQSAHEYRWPRLWIIIAFTCNVLFRFTWKERRLTKVRGKEVIVCPKREYSKSLQLLLVAANNSIQEALKLYALNPSAVNFSFSRLKRPMLEPFCLESSMMAASAAAAAAKSRSLHTSACIRRLDRTKASVRTGI